MKKLMLLLVVALSFVTVTAQTDVESVVSRSGNTYAVDGSVMNKKAFMGFLQSKDAVTYQTFRNGYRLSNVGWGLFGGGLLVEALSFPFVMYGYNEGLKQNSDGTVVSWLATAPLTSLGYSLEAAIWCYTIGSATTISGIVCLGVGYGRMHKAADGYIQQRSRKPTQVSLSLNSSRDGIGLALSF